MPDQNQISPSDLYPIPANEAERLQALEDYLILDTGPEDAFDNLTRLASLICKTPVSLISLIDSERQWFKSRQGFDAASTPRRISFCQHAIMQEEVYVVENAAESSIFVNNPLVTGDYHVRFYAGAPLIDPNGFILGTLCVLDSEPNHLSDEQIEMLRLLSGEVVQNLELRKRNYDLEKARKRVEDTQKIKEEFFANMSHEIRTPMNGVVGMTSLLLNTALTKEQKEYVETIRLSGDSLLTIINDILDYSKFEAGKIELEVQSYEIRNIIEECFELLSIQAVKKHIDLLYSIDENVPEVISGDVTRIRQILVNLISNAIKFTEKGEVEVTIRLAGKSPMDEYEIEFAVRDTGIGIKESEIGLLFSAYTQIDASNTRKYGGTGLGLAIVAKLAALMDGKAWASSQYGVGSIFYFTIEVKEGESDAASTLPDMIEAVNGKSILIIDDNTTNLKILTRQCAYWNMKPQAVKGAAPALDLLKYESFDIIVVDLQMPDIDGLDLAYQIRSNKATSQIPIILFSSIGFLPQGREHYRSIFSSVIEKPLKYRQLLTALSSSFRRHSQHLEVMNIPAKARKNADLRMKVLVAEDNVINQKLINNILAKIGYKADLVSNGLEAVEALRRQEYHIVMMDVQMPEMNGLEATEVVRSMFHARKQPILIAVTANATEQDRKQCLDHGMDDYLSKPYKIDSINEKLQVWEPIIKERFGESFPAETFIYVD